MEKRYQVFVSSTYADLREERAKVIRALMEMDCMPAGMELFPAADEEQWAFIRRVIDDCDYYVLIIGGRYGSVTVEGASYTEKEYDYALEKGIKALVFVHSDPEHMSPDKTEDNPELQARLAAFRERAATGRLVKMWKHPEDLPGLVALSLNKTIKTYPAVGWVRGNQVANEVLLQQLNEVRLRNSELEGAIAKLVQPEQVEIPDLAGLDENVTMTGKCWRDNYHLDWAVTVTWARAFGIIAPHLMAQPHDEGVRGIATTEFFKLSGKSGSLVTIEDQDFQTLKVQLIALRLVAVRLLQSTSGGMQPYWSLTKKGEATMMGLRSIRTANN